METTIIRDLDARRRKLGMSKKDVAVRAKLSLPTVNRVLSGRQKAPSYTTLASIAAALGVVVKLGATVEVVEPQSANKYRQQQAREKAKRLAEMVQGTMALESQGVDADQIEYLIESNVGELLNSSRKLWGE